MRVKPFFYVFGKTHQGLIVWFAAKPLGIMGTWFITQIYVLFELLYYPIVLCIFNMCTQANFTKIVSEYDQEIPQSQTADNPVAPRGRAAQPSQDIRKTN